MVEPDPGTKKVITKSSTKIVNASRPPLHGHSNKTGAESNLRHKNSLQLESDIQRQKTAAD